MLVYLITGVALLLYLVLVWFLGSWFPLRAPDVWILRGGLALVGIVAAAVILWFYRKSKQVQQSEELGEARQGMEEIDLLVHEALAALKKSTLARGATLRNQPLIFFVGDPGAAKTNVIIHSGLDPELLAGQVYQDNNILATRVANVWYTQSAILLDAAGTLLQQPARWKRLVQLVRPGRAASALKTSQQAPRAAVICFDIANFLKPGAGEANLAIARKLAARLHDITQMLSISLPVYVLFTKLDRLQGFTEFARMLSPDEAAQVLGATMPIRSFNTGVYADDETKRLTATFEELFFSLADKRLDLLARENDADSLPSIYEFPRELRKLRTLLVQFLVELARPSRLRVNPFLRGFYFSGVRPVFVEDGVAAAPQASASDRQFDGGATQVFSSPMAQPAAAAAIRSSGRRKVPQWTFLSRLFNEVIVRDRVALAASGVSSKVNLIRRIAWISAAVLSLVAMAGFLVSYIGNRQLERNVQAAAAEVQHLGTNPHQLPSLSDLQKLDRLREELVTLATYDKEGVPLRLRWFLYVGDKIGPDARRAYFSAFKQLLFDDAQAAIKADLHRLPDQPGPNESFDATYNELKTYLITAENHDKADNEFPASVLTERWKATKNPDQDRIDLAQRQFIYYGAELKSGYPIAVKPDQSAIDHARAYLAKFAGTDLYYGRLIGQASSVGEANFYTKFQDATGIIVGAHSVKGAFTPAGHNAFSAAIQDISHSLAKEEWVLGKPTATALDQASLQQELMQRYQQDFVKEWRTMLESSHVQRYDSFSDADQKLDRLASTSSPLLELLWFVATNTNVEKLNEPFASVDTVEPPGSPDKRPDQLVQPSNQPYIKALNNLQAAVKNFSQAGPNDPTALNNLTSAESQAHQEAKSAVGTKIDNQYQHTEQLTQRLLEEPITNVEAIVGSDAVRELNGRGQALCAQFSQMANLYPFNSKSDKDVTIEDFNTFFAPKTGALWSFYEKLSKYVTKDGLRYREADGSSLKINPRSLEFFSRMATISNAFYPNNSPTPNVAYELSLYKTNLHNLVLSIDKDNLIDVGVPHSFVWNGSSQLVQVKQGEPTLVTQTGTWAIVRFIQSGTAATHSYMDLRWDLKSNDKPAMVGNEQAFYSYRLQTGSPNPFELVSSPAPHCDAHVALSKAGQ